MRKAKLNRLPTVRRHYIKKLVCCFIKNGRLYTTKTKANIVKRMVNRLVHKCQSSMEVREKMRFCLSNLENRKDVAEHLIKMLPNIVSTSCISSKKVSISKEGHIIERLEWILK